MRGGNGNEWKLPSGRHRLSREVVVAHQRSRLLSAVAQAIAEHGYAAVSVRHVIENAGVSRATFYQQFDDLKGCVLAACRETSERLVGDIASACASENEWPAGVAAAVDAGIAFTAAEPARVGLLLIGTSAADPQLTRCASAVRDQLVGLLRAGRERCPDAATELELTEQALVGGLVSVVAARLSANQVDSLDGLKPELVQLLLTPYLGAPEARRIAVVG